MKVAVQDTATLRTLRPLESLHTCEPKAGGKKLI